MSIEVIRGAFGSGKTTYILDSIGKKIGSGRKNIIVVPEQFSYVFEKEICQRFGGAGLNGVEVITLKRLCSRYLPKKRGNILTSAGKMMIIYKALANLPEDSIFHSSLNKPGFMDTVATLLEEFSQYMISPEILRKKAESVENRLLKEKILAISEILEEYNKVIGEGFYDSKDDSKRLADFSEESGCFSDCDFWFDEFSILLPQHYSVIEAFLKGGSDVHITVSVDKEAGEIYRVNERIIRRLKGISERLSAGYSEFKTDDLIKSTNSGEIKFLAENIDKINSPDFLAWDDKTKDISVFISKDLYKEVRHTALSIRKLIMEEGFRYRDISVVCGDIEGYRHIIEAVFSDCSIPYFADSKIDTVNHPVSTVILSAFNILVENWSYPSVFRYLRTGILTEKTEEGELLDLDEDSLDLLENYVLKYGIRGKSVWLSDEKWEQSQKGLFEGVLGKDKYSGFAEDEIKKINSIRKIIIAPFVDLYEKLSSRRTVREFSKGLFEFLGDINLYSSIERKIAEFNEMGLNNEAAQFSMVWNLLIEVLDQAVAVMGDEKCSREEFSGLIKSGLSASDIAIIPTGLDRVSVSGIERSRQHQVRVMFILGAVQGAIPKESISGGLLGDNERTILNQELNKDGFEIAPDSNEANEIDRFNFFDTIFGVRDKIIISYPAADSEENVMRPSMIIGEFYKVFPNMTTDDDFLNYNEEEYLYSPRSAYQYMLWEKGREGLSHDIYEWFEKNDNEKIKVLDRAGKYKIFDAKISEENAERLYEKTDYSITRLGEFGKCPFGYFVKYGLNAKDREIWQLQKFDLGSIMHMAIEEYSKRIDNGAADFETLRNNWLNLTDEESTDLICEIMTEIGKKITDGLNRDQNKIRYVMMRMTKILSKTIGVLRKSMTAGEYVAVAYEKKFRVEVKWQDKGVFVKGTVDRVDLAENPEKKIAELRIVDYKTGKKKFSVVDICNKQDIQLVMYAIAAIEMYKSGDIKYAKTDFEPKMRAICYNVMRDDYVAISGEDEDIEDKKAMSMVPNGLILLDEEDGEYDLSGAERLDKDVLKNHKSQVMKMKITAKGEVSKRDSEVESQDGFSMLMDYVKKSVIEIDDEIFKGVITICPKKGNMEPCQWCEYGEVCLYNDRFDKNIDGVTDEGEAWEKIKKEVREDEENVD